MSNDILTYYENIYSEVPEWVAKMYEYNPIALEHYTGLRNQILIDGALSRKDKELILVGINAARRYERSMLYHSKGALDEGATIQEFVEILTTCILSRGIPVWFEGIKAIEYALDYKGGTIQEIDQKELAIENAIEYFKRENDGELPQWASLMNKYASESFTRYAALRQNELKDSVVSRKLKELVLVGINLSERYEAGAKLHIESARKEGATEQEIAEVGLVSVLTAGIPAWFHTSDYLK